MTEISDTGTYPLPNIHARQSSLPSWMYKLSGRGYRYIFFIMKTIHTGLTRCMWFQVWCFQFLYQNVKIMIQKWKILHVYASSRLDKCMKINILFTFFFGMVIMKLSTSNSNPDTSSTTVVSVNHLHCVLRDNFYIFCVWK